MTSDKIFILQRAQLGDRKAMRLIYEEYYQYVLDYCHRYLMNYSESKDVTQDVFIRIFDKMGSYSFQSDFGAWLNVVCRNHIISYLRTRNKNRFESLPENIRDISEDDDIEESELETYRKNLSINELYDMLSRLDEKSRTIFNLYSIEGMTHKEIGTLLGISEGTSKSQLSRARVKLKDLLNHEFQKRNLREKSQPIIKALVLLISILIKGTIL